MRKWQYSTRVDKYEGKLHIYFCTGQILRRKNFTRHALVRYFDLYGYYAGVGRGWRCEVCPFNSLCTLANWPFVNSYTHRGLAPLLHTVIIYSQNNSEEFGGMKKYQLGLILYKNYKRTTLN